MTMAIWGGKKPYDQEPEEEACHYVLELLEWERDRLLALVNRTSHLTYREREWLATRLKDARRVDGPPLPVAQLDWRLAEREAQRRGESLADFIWDKGRQPEPPAAA